MNIPDVELLDQNGRKIHFYTDLVKGKTVAINFIFTTCTTICPPLGATFARVQKELGDKVGRDVHFISISVDPATDTPERLKAWGAKFHAGDGWTFVTGAKPQVDELLRALGASSARREDHTPTILIGNDAHGSWTRTYGLAKASELVQIINDAIAASKTKTAEDTSPAQKYFTDVELLNQNGEKVRFYTRCAQRQDSGRQRFLHDLHFGMSADEPQHGKNSGSVRRSSRSRCLPRLDHG